LQLIRIQKKNKNEYLIENNAALKMEKKLSAAII